MFLLVVSSNSEMVLLSVSCSWGAVPLRQALLSAAESFSFALVYIPQSPLTARTFLSIKLTLTDYP